MVSVLAFLRVDQREAIDRLQEAQYPLIPPPQLCSEEAFLEESFSFVPSLSLSFSPAFASSQPVWALSGAT